VQLNSYLIFSPTDSLFPNRMKIYLAAFLCWTLSGGILYAQKSTYLKAEVGFGRGTVRESPRGWPTPVPPAWRALPASRLSVSGGVQAKKLNVEIGFGYARGGGRATLTRARSTVPGALFVSADHRYTHLTLPVSAGYNFMAGKRWSLQPRLGLEGGYLISQGLTDRYVSDGTEAYYLPLHPRRMKDFTLSASSALHLHYRITPNIEIFGGPSYRHMLTNGAAETLYTQPPYYKLRTASTTFDAGLRLHLKSASPVQRAPQE
jgi:hypothetical protein